MSKQVSVPLDGALLGFVERAAERESRTVAAQIRHFIAAAMTHAGSSDAGSATAGSEPWPPPLAAVSRDTLSEIRARVRDLEAERDALQASRHDGPLDLMPHDEVRLQYLLETIRCLQRHIGGIEFMTTGNHHGAGVPPAGGSDRIV